MSASYDPFKYLGCHDLISLFYTFMFPTPML